MIELTWYVSLQKCKEQLEKEEKYGYGMYLRKISKGLKVNPETVERHRQSYLFWQDLYFFKFFGGPEAHPPLWTMEPRWEQEIAYEWWRGYFSFLWRGAKSEQPIRYFD